MILKVICIIFGYLIITFESVLTSSRKETEAMKKTYKDSLTDKNTIQSSVIQPVHTNTADELVDLICGKGYTFEEGEKAIVAFKQNYYNKMIKVKGKIGKIDYDKNVIIFNSNPEKCWEWISVRAIVDNVSLYSKYIGQNINIVGRCLGMNSVGELYIDGGQIEQELPEDCQEVLSTLSKKYDIKISVQDALRMYKTYGDGNIIYNYFNGKIVNLTGHVIHIDNNKMILSGRKYDSMLDEKVYVYGHGLKFYYNLNEEISINVKYRQCDNLLKNMKFDLVQ